MIKAMIITLGGSHEPIVKTITEKTHLPEIICFLATHESVSLVGRIAEGASKDGLRYTQKVIITDDHADMVECYRKSLLCIDFIRGMDCAPTETVVDITGGTKVMSSAMALAALGKGYTFSYVGGTERTKDGLGVVISGSEFIKQGVGPWHIFAIEEKRALALHVNSYRFSSAIEIVNDLILRGKAVEGYGYLKSLKIILEGYEAWEAFKHEKALNSLKTGTAELRSKLEVLPCPAIENYLGGVNKNLEFFGKLRATTNKFEKPSEDTVIDLIANAERRANEGKYDDATARVYRALEMVGQIEFEKVFGHPTSKVPFDIIPEKLRDEYTRKHLAPGAKTLKIPLHDTFLALDLKGNRKGKTFFAHLDEIKKLQRSRNESILAHGVSQIAPEKFSRFITLVRELFAGQKKIEFPNIQGDW